MRSRVAWSTAAAVAAVLSCTPDPCAAEATAPPRVVFQTSRGERVAVRVEVARTEPQRERGLMFRERLGQDEGMLFVFDDEGEHSFWMKNTLIPLDMIFIDGLGNVTGVVARAEPRTLTGRMGGPSRYVVEVNGGFCEKHGLRAGDRVRFENLPP